MSRCLQLAKLGAGKVAPNPMVGAVLVYNDKIIGEGYHRQYGKSHAEVNCIASVSKEDEHLIEKSTIYVSLEPCAHFGKTPPCADLIIKHKIPRAVIGCRDPFTEVNGKGIEKLKAAGVEVVLNVLEYHAKQLNKRFFTFHTKHRPYIILKWAQSSNGIIGIPTQNRILISNEYSNRLVHKWRSEEASILVGTNTARLDNPSLTTRLWNGKNPVRLVVDMDLKLLPALRLFNDDAATIVFNRLQNTIESFEELNTGINKTWYYQVTTDVNLVHQIVDALYHLNIQSVLIEGGAALLQSFIDEDIWDEARIITNNELQLNAGVKAPELNKSVITSTENMLSDTIAYYSNTQH